MNRRDTERLLLALYTLDAPLSDPVPLKIEAILIKARADAERIERETPHVRANWMKASMTKSIAMMILALTVAAFAAGCGPTPGVARSTAGTALVSVTAGDLQLRSGSSEAFYIVDREARLCWFMAEWNAAPSVTSPLFGRP